MGQQDDFAGHSQFWPHDKICFISVKPRKKCGAVFDVKVTLYYAIIVFCSYTKKKYWNKTRNGNSRWTQMVPILSRPTIIQLIILSKQLFLLN